MYFGRNAQAASTAMPMQYRTDNERQTGDDLDFNTGKEMLQRRHWS